MAVSSGSRITRSGLVSLPQIQTLRPARLVKMLVEENSEPVPAVVGRQSLGSVRRGRGWPSMANAAGTVFAQRQGGGDLADVHGRAAAETDHQARALAADEGGRRVELLLFGLAGDLGEQRDRGACGLEGGHQPGRDPELDQRPVGDQDHRLPGLAERRCVLGQRPRRAPARNGPPARV